MADEGEKEETNTPIIFSTSSEVLDFAMGVKTGAVKQEENAFKQNVQTIWLIILLLTQNQILQLIFYHPLSFHFV